MPKKNGPKLPNLKGGGKTVKGTYGGIQDFDRNDLSKPYPGLKKAKLKKQVNSVNV